MKKRFRPIATRKKLGISQETYIQFLRVTLSMLSMYEIQQRFLSGRAGTKATAIELYLLNNPIVEGSVEQTLQEADLKLLAKRRDICLGLIIKTNLKLEKMKEAYLCCLNMMRVATALPEVLTDLVPDFELEDWELDWLEGNSRMASYKLEECGIGQQQLLQLKIDALRYEAERIQQILPPELTAN